MTHCPQSAGRTQAGQRRHGALSPAGLASPLQLRGPWRLLGGSWGAPDAVAVGLMLASASSTHEL